MIKIVFNSLEGKFRVKVAAGLASGGDHCLVYPWYLIWLIAMSSHNGRFFIFIPIVINFIPNIDFPIVLLFLKNSTFKYPRYFFGKGIVKIGWP